MRHTGRSYRLLLKLYPLEFRERYGRDLIALIEDSGSDDSQDRIRWSG